MGSTQRPAHARLWRAGAQAALLSGLAACQAACPLPGQRPMTRLDLYFGRDIPGGGMVDEAAWRDFAARVLTPAFPDGLTVVQAHGQWRDPARGRITGEPSFVVTVLGAAPAARAAAVAQAYKSRFHQQSVGIVTQPACAAF